MDESSRLLIGASLISTIQTLVGGTLVYFIRKHNELSPSWSWLKATGFFLLLSFIITAVTFIPAIGHVLAIGGSLAGLMGLTRLPFSSAFIVLICMSIFAFVLSLIISMYLSVDLFSWSPIAW